MLLNESPSPVFLLDDLRFAVERKELFFLYQPQLSQDDKHYIEVLLRWDHPQWGIIPPEHFIPLAHTYQLLSNITTWVVRSVMDVIVHTHKNVIFAINVCPSLLTTEFTSALIQEAHTHNIDPKRVEIELTESINANLTSLNLMIKKLRSAGFLISLDDFGSGYSNMTSLASLDIDTVKIDKTLIRQANETPFGFVVLKTLIGLCQTLNRHVVCEGIETQAQMDMVRGLGTNRIQGYHVSKPVPLLQALNTHSTFRIPA